MDSLVKRILLDPIPRTFPFHEVKSDVLWGKDEKISLFISCRSIPVVEGDRLKTDTEVLVAGSNPASGILPFLLSFSA